MFGREIKMGMEGILCIKVDRWGFKIRIKFFVGLGIVGIEVMNVVIGYVKWV